MKNRSPKIDNIKGMMIACVVLGHVIEIIPKMSDWQGGGIWSALYAALYLFHMPVFIFISGYLSSEKQLETVVTSLLFLYLIAQAAWCLFSLVLTPLTGAPIEIMRFINIGIWPQWGLWYLLSLFFWRTTIPLLSNTRYPLLGLLILCGYAVCIGTSNLDGTLSLSRTISFYPFFAAGYWSKRDNWKITSAPFRHLDIGLIAIGLIMGAFLAAYAYRNSLLLLHFNVPFYKTGTHLMAGGLFRLGVFLSVFSIIRLLFLFTSSAPTIFTRCGARSLTVYLGHLYVLYFFVILLPKTIWVSQMWWLAPLFTVFSCTVFSSFDIVRYLRRMQKTMRLIVFNPPSENAK